MSDASSTNKLHHRRIQLRDATTVQAVEAMAEMDRRTPAAQIAWLVDREWQARHRVASEAPDPGIPTDAAKVEALQKFIDGSAAAVIEGEPK